MRNADKAKLALASINTVDITPTWRGVLPILIAGLQDGSREGQRIARIELERMADLADRCNEQTKGGRA